MAKLSQPMIEALIVARVQGSVWTGARWELGVGYVKSGTICALIDRDLIMRSPRGEWELTRKGYFALLKFGIITQEMCEQEQNGWDELIDAAHTEALIEAGDRVGYYVGSDVAPAEALAERDEPVVTRSCGRRWTTSHRSLTCDVRVSEGQYNAAVSNQHSAHEGPCYDAMRRVWSSATAQYPDPVKLGGGLIAEAPEFVIDDGTKLHELRCALAEVAGQWQGSSNLTRRLDGLELERVLQEFK